MSSDCFRVDTSMSLLQNADGRYACDLWLVLVALITSVLLRCGVPFFYFIFIFFMMFGGGFTSLMCVRVALLFVES